MSDIEKRLERLEAAVKELAHRVGVPHPHIFPKHLWTEEEAAEVASQQLEWAEYRKQQQEMFGTWPFGRPFTYDAT